MLSLKLKTIFISDVHLGTSGAKADRLFDFLTTAEFDKLYLVGDFIDGWRLTQRWHLPESHQRLIEFIIESSKKNLEVFYLNGNHDDFWRSGRYHSFIPSTIKMSEQATHIGLDGKKYLVIHGDQVDQVVKKAKWLALIGDLIYRIALVLNYFFNLGRKLCGKPYWSFSLWGKQKIKQIFTGNHYERDLITLAKQQGMDGVICGHSHKAVDSVIDGIRYLNDGDWVESCTAVVESQDGQFSIFNWFQWQGK